MHTIGQRIRSRREALGLTRAELADVSRVSVRFVAGLELGEANASMQKLVAICRALGLTMEKLFAEPLLDMAPPPRRWVMALLGLRGAGKSTVGRRLAPLIQADFHELDREVEERAGLSLAELFELHGEEYYRAVEAETLEQLLQEAETRRHPKVIATSGGIVRSPTAWRTLRDCTHTVWLRAEPNEHMERVLHQEDDRPFENRPHAAQELRALLETRIPLYEQADWTVDTTGRTVDAVVDALALLWQNDRD